MSSCEIVIDDFTIREYLFNPKNSCVYMLIMCQHKDSQITTV